MGRGGNKRAVFVPVSSQTLSIRSSDPSLSHYTELPRSSLSVCVCVCVCVVCMCVWCVYVCGVCVVCVCVCVCGVCVCGVCVCVWCVCMCVWCVCVCTKSQHFWHTVRGFAYVYVNTKLISFLGPFEALREVTVSFVNICLSVCASTRTTRLSRDGFLWNLVFKYVSKICPPKFQFLLYWQE